MPFMQDLIVSAAAAQAQARYLESVRFGENLLSQGFDNSAHTQTVENIQKTVSASYKYVGISDYWKILPFVSGDDAHGYWISKTELENFIQRHTKGIKTMWIIALALIIFGLVGLGFIYFS